MRSLKRVFIKSFYYLILFFIKFLDYLSPRIYMICLNKLFKVVGMKIRGNIRYCYHNCFFDDFDMISLGDRLVISKNVQFLTHDYSLTTGLICLGDFPKTDCAFKKEIKLGSNVFIGLNVILLPGTSIGDNVIVGAGTVIRGDIPSNSIVLGNPGVVVSKLDEKARFWKSNLSRMENIVFD